MKVGPDGSWTRSRSSYGVLGDKELRAGITVYKPIRRVTDKYYTILIPDQPARTLLEGYKADAMPPEFTGGLGPEGVKHLRDFVETGGTLVFLNRASNFAIEQFKLPVRNVVAGLPRTDFYVPGSILRIELDTSHPLARGMPKETIAWAEDSPVLKSPMIRTPRFRRQTCASLRRIRQIKIRCCLAGCWVATE